MQKRMSTGASDASASPSNAAGRLAGIWLKRVRRGPMDPAQHAVLVAGRGIVGNTDQGGRRQVTLLQKEAWKEVGAALGAELDPSVRRANLLIEGVSLQGARGRTLEIGSCRIVVGGETRPCERMDEALAGLQRAMRAGSGGGVFGQVVTGGEIRIGDTVRWADE